MDPKKMAETLNKAQTMERKTANTFSTISRFVYVLCETSCC
jgi:hypothetical protein